MPSYDVELVMSVTCYAKPPEAAEAAAPILAETKLACEGTGCLVVQAAEETQGDA